MDMPTAVKTVLGKYATFSGRAPRSEYWWWTLALLIVFIGLGLIDALVITPALGFKVGDPTAGQPLSMLVSLAIFLPCLAVSVRRLHDTDRTGWWLLVGLVPIVGGLVLLYFYVSAGTEGENQFG